MTKPDFSEVWESLVKKPLVNCHPDSNPCDHGKYAVCVQCLQNLFDQYPDWDGYGANPVNAESLMRVRKFVMELPDDVEKPESTPEPDGDVTMVWKKDGHHVCMVVIKPTGELIISVARGRILQQSFETKHIHLTEDQLPWPVRTKYELYAWLQAAYRE